MNVLVIGSGGREHALCHALRRSRGLGRLFILPGNAGTAELGTNVPGDACDIRLALEVARREDVGLTIVGPEDPLAAGIVDAFEAAGRRIFGPTAAAARLESDKAFAKQLMRQHAIPTAEARVFTDFHQAEEYVLSRTEPLVVKASGELAGSLGLVSIQAVHRYRQPWRGHSSIFPRAISSSQSSPLRRGALVGIANVTANAAAG